MVSVSEKIELHPAIHVSGDHMCKPCQMTRTGAASTERRAAMAAMSVMEKRILDDLIVVVVVVRGTSACMTWCEAVAGDRLWLEWWLSRSG